MILNLNDEINHCLNIVKEEWLAASCEFPDYLSEIPPVKKLQNEQNIRTFSDDFQKQIKSFPRIPLQQKSWKRKTLTMVMGFLNSETILNIHDSMSALEIDAFEEELEEFMRHARKFSPELHFEEIGQAIRNYMVYGMFKKIHQVNTGFSLAGFGYSMLYPFTDNYIDSTAVTDKDKAEYNQMIRDKIAGKEVHPNSEHQVKTCELLQDIEDEYPRDQDTAIFTLLQMMLQAQEDSLRQQHRHTLLTAGERLDVSVFKGGISVLIDRYLVRKELTKEELIFYLGMGFFLQLADDLQDISSDSAQGYQTLFTLDLSHDAEEKAVNKLLHFIRNITEAYHAENDTFKDFVLSNCYQLIFTSLAGSREFFSGEYSRQIEKYLPVTYAFLEEWRSSFIINKDEKTQTQYMQLMDHIIF